MKRILYILILILGITTVSHSQQRGGGGQVEALKIAYITKALNLSTAEAQRFWPVYNKYNKEAHEVRKQHHKSPISETEEKLLAIRKKYNTEFSTAIGQEKTNAFFRADKEFGNVVLKTYNQRKNKMDE